VVGLELSCDGTVEDAVVGDQAEERELSASSSVVTAEVEDVISPEKVLANSP
jgi:hypothetical protein